MTTDDELQNYEYWSKVSNAEKYSIAKRRLANFVFLDEVKILCKDSSVFILERYANNTRSHVTSIEPFKASDDRLYIHIGKPGNDKAYSIQYLMKHYFNKRLLNNHYVDDFVPMTKKCKSNKIDLSKYNYTNGKLQLKSVVKEPDPVVTKPVKTQRKTTRKPHVSESHEDFIERLRMQEPQLAVLLERPIIVALRNLAHNTVRSNSFYYENCTSSAPEYQEFMQTLLWKKEYLY